VDNTSLLAMIRKVPGESQKLELPLVHDLGEV
jgi:hypothetical protein